MREIAAILLSFLILSVSAKEMAVFMVFKINQNYIAKNLCVNRNAPELKCHGKCQLTRVVTENKNKEDKYPASNPENKQLTFLVDVLLEICFFNEEQKQPLLAGYVNNYSHLFTTNIFQPPRV